MSQLNPYLSFNGNCREAMEFYRDSLGGELSIQTIEEANMSGDFPDMKDKIMHSALLKNGSVLLMASDFLGPGSLVSGNNISLTLNCDSEDEVNNLFSKLSDGGHITHPPKEEFWGGVYADFADKYGINWMLNYQKTPMQI